MEGNTTMNSTMDSEVAMERILHNVRAFQGSLMIAGIIHAFVGFSGLIGLLMNLIGPVTIVPCMLLVGVFLARISLAFIQVHWGIALLTAAVGVILSLYLGNNNMPVPVWTPSQGLRIIWYPLHQVFAILISILVNWLLCGVLTYAGVFTDDPNNTEYKSRTDARIDVIQDSPWFNFPYPGQYGMVSFSTAAFISCFIATILSILDSISDYYACARVCRVPAPPSHAVNRGILVEGICSFLSGAIGCGHATTTSGGNIGAIGITKVASRHVFVVAGIIYILFGILGKFSAIFITIPYPVLGGAIILMWGTFFGVILSNLQVLNMSSSRNMSIIGISIFVGLMIPLYIRESKNPIKTGHEGFDSVMTMILGMPNLAGSIIACFLDNTVPGNREDRGIAAWQVSKGTEDSVVLDPDLYDEGYEVYHPLLPKRFLEYRIMKYIPFLPYVKRNKEL